MRDLRGQPPHAADRLEGAAPAIQALRARIRQLAAFDAIGGHKVPVLLLQGETGTGKGLAARIVHDSGPRGQGPFIPVNCAAIPETMLEAELFGFEPGAFTDARRGKPGLFEAASGGTLFLDEIDSLSLGLQSKLLTAIESMRIRRLGSVVEHAVDVKLIAATQQDLGVLAAAGRFRSDLYHRLAVVVLALPPLRERADDAVLLAGALLERFAAAYGVAPKRLTAEAEERVRRHPWPGNVRELGHLMERVTLLHEESEIDAPGLDRLMGPGTPTKASVDPGSRSEPDGAGAGSDVSPSTAAGEEIRRALERTGGNVSKAARLLGLSRDTIRYRMRLYRIGRPDLDEPLPPPPVAVTSARRPGAERLSPTVDPPPAAADPVPASLDETGPPPSAASVTAPAWEQKPVAIVAVELTWPEPAPSALPGHEPWTEVARWERAIREKLAGLGGVLLQQSPSLLVWGFGLPRALDQLPQRAVHGALAVRNLLAGLSGREHVPAMRIAVHLGAMLVDSAAPDPVPRALPVGETLVLPIRLLGEATPGEILASAEVARRIDAWMSLDRLELRPRSSGEAVTAYRVVGVSPWRERGRRPRGRSLSPLVGRARELTTLRELLEVAAGGAGQVVGIVGEPGVGKSRLLYELREIARARDVRYVEAHCLAHGSLTPYLPVVEMLRGYFELDDSDPAEAIAEKVRAGLATLGMDPAASAPYLIPLLGPDLAAGPPVGEDARARTFEAIRQMAFGLCRDQLFVLAFDNVQWIDPTSEALVASLAEHLYRRAILLVTTYRPGYRPPWLHGSHATQVALRPLDTEDSRQLVRATARAASLPPAVETQVLATAEGNPFFLEELVRGVVEQHGATSLAIPDTVHAVVTARIDRLAPDDKRLLQTAAVIGRNVPLGLLERVSGLEVPDLQARLARLQAAEFLFEARQRPERTWAFRHVLTHAAAYEGLLPSTRRILHLRVVETLVGAARPEQFEELAHHAVQAAAWEKAATFFRQAADRARQRHAHREATRCLEGALSGLARLPEDSATRRQAWDLRMNLVHSLYVLGEVRRALPMIAEIERLTETLGDDRRRGRVFTALLYLHAADGNHLEAAGAGERALALATAGGDIGGQIWASAGLASVHFALGNYRRAIECTGGALDALSGQPAGARFGVVAAVLAPVLARAWRAMALARTGDLPEALEHGRQAVRIAEEAGDRVDQVWAHYALGRVHHARTEFADAMAVLERALALCEGGDFPLYSPRIISSLASAYLQADRVDEALTLLARALGEARSVNLQHGHSLLLAQYGRAYLVAGRLEDADRLAAEALVLARGRGERGDEAWALLLHGEIAAGRRPADVEAARGWYAQALALADALGMRPLAARCRMMCGALEVTGGRSDEARSWLLPATEELRAMGITAWLGRAEALLAALPDRRG